MIKSRSTKLRGLVLFCLLCMALWCGYWVGYVVHHNVQPSQITGQHVESAMSQKAALQHDSDVKNANSGKVFEEVDRQIRLQENQQPYTAMNQGVKVGKGNLLEDVRAKLMAHESQQQQLLDAAEAQAAESAVEPKQSKQSQQKEVRESAGKNVPLNDEFYSLIHDGIASRVHGKIHEKLNSLPEDIDKQAYIFESKRLPQNIQHRPSVGNGHIATAVHSLSMHMNGLFNGYLEKSHRAVIPSTCALNISGTYPGTTFARTYRLNTGEGIYSEVSESADYTVTQRLYAHRELTRLLVVEIDLVRKQLQPLALNITLNKWTPSRDITFLTGDSGMKEVSYKKGHTNAAETDDDRPHEVHVLYDHVPDHLIPPANQARVKWVFLTSVAHTKEEAFEAYKKGAALIKNNDALYAGHVQAWADLWSRGSVHVHGNLTVARALYGSQYYLFSSLPTREDPTNPFIGLSPSGLPFGIQNKDYQGHVFWDQETWMYPPILFLQSDIAKILLETRLRTAVMAEKWSNKNGHKGMQFPWESGFTGWDVTPDATCSTYELHISGDISYAILQYLHATQDSSILKASEVSVFIDMMEIKNVSSKIPPQKNFLDILAGVANFWVSKLTFNQQRHAYDINRVLPPDEDAGVHNNSVYTNTIAQIALEALEYAYELIGMPDSRWTSFADSIFIPFDTKQQYHPEYEGYKQGTKIKQADAILLGYPLLRPMSDIVRRNDLKIYQRVTRPTGPAMTWCMFSINWLELGEHNLAHQMFHKNFEYIDPDFQVWNEQTSGDGAANFLTGVGGFLQNIIAGYGGFRLHRNHVAFNCTVLPPGVSSMNFMGMDYLGSSIEFFVSVSDGTMIFTLTGRAEGAKELVVFINEPEQVHTLVMGQALRLGLSAGAILAKGSDLPEE